MSSGFQAKKLNTCGELELELAANQAEPENQADLVPGPDPEQKWNFKFFFQNIKPETLLVQHVKGQADLSRYVREKGCVTFDANRDTPCSTRPLLRDLWAQLQKCYCLLDIQIRPAAISSKVPFELYLSSSEKSARSTILICSRYLSPSFPDPFHLTPWMILSHIFPFYAFAAYLYLLWAAPVGLVLLRFAESDLL